MKNVQKYRPMILYGSRGIGKSYTFATSPYSFEVAQDYDEAVRLRLERDLKSRAEKIIAPWYCDVI